jgi:23S rRNA (guanosine2251-2'-O)-methyltransferase
MKHIFGIHTVIYALKYRSDDILKIYISPSNNSRLKEIEKLSKELGKDIFYKSTNQLNIIANIENHQGVVIEMKKNTSSSSFDEIIEQKQDGIILVLDGIQDPRNLGACCRSAAAFGVNAIVITKHHSAPINSVAEKVSCGGIQLLPIFSISNIPSTLIKMKKNNFWIYGASEHSKKTVLTKETSYHKPCVLVIGSEEKGIRQAVLKQCDEVISIPTTTLMPSLNVSVAAGILLFNMSRD